MEIVFELKIILNDKKEIVLSESEARELQIKLNTLFGETKTQFIPYQPYTPILPVWYKAKPLPYDWYTVYCSSDTASTFKIDDNYVSRNSSVSSDTAKITLENNNGEITY